MVTSYCRDDWLQWGIFRQLIPRFLTWRNPENKLLFLLPFMRPFYPIMSFTADPFARFLREKELQKIETTLTPNQIEEKTEDNAEDFQALMEVGEAEGILDHQDSPCSSPRSCM